MQENLVNTDTKDLIITYGMPYKPASSDIISRWIKDEQVMACINTNGNKLHSVDHRQQCWSTSTSKARDNGLVITDILK